jgi:hypothetical protein
VTQEMANSDECIIFGAGKPSVTLRIFFSECVLIDLVRGRYSRSVHFLVSAPTYTDAKLMWSSQWRIGLEKRALSSALCSLFVRVWKLLSHWNWKSAVLSVMLRVPVFAIAAMKHGPEAVAGAALTEAAVCAINAGTYSSVLQVLRNRKPVWLVAIIVTVVLPVCGQIIEYFVHVWHKTPHTTAAAIVSSVLGAISYLFNWYAMKQGTLLVGGEQSSLVSDVKRIPVLLYHFFLLVPHWLSRRFGESALPSQ